MSVKHMNNNIFNKLRNLRLNKPKKLGTCSFELFALSTNPIRADYSVDVLDNQISEEFLLTRTWPLFLEHNIGKINTTQRDEIIKRIPYVFADFEAGVKLNNPAYVDGEMMIARFADDLFLGKGMYIINHFVNQPYSGTANRISVDSALGYITVWTLGLALRRLPVDAAKLLEFFVGYGLSKWKRNDYPGLITGYKPTWDFSNIGGMIEEWNIWHPNK